MLSRAQFWMAIAVVGFLVGTTATLDLLARSETISQWVMRSDQEMYRVNKQRYSYENYFVDFEDRLINQELPGADYSRGGVYLIGTSNLKWATRFWELPEKERALIHNYGMGSFNHAFQFQFLRYLAEHKDLFAAGGEKNLVIFGTTYHDAGTVYNPDGFFPNVWGRHGLYRYDVKTGITPLPASELWRDLHFRRVRIAGFFKSVLSTIAHRFGYRMKPRRHDVEFYNRERRDWMGPNWQEKIRSQVAEFDAMTDYLLARGVRVVVVYLPLGTWEDRLPFERAYIDAMNEVTSRKAIPTMDWSKILDDDDFADSNHPNLSGVDKLNPRFLEIAIPFLQSSGALQ
jgi:hypothetical protein